MLDPTLALKAATPADLAGVDTLLARSYPRLLARDYPPSVLVMAVPIIARARPELLASGRYFVVVQDDGAILGAGGYSLAVPGNRGAEPGPVTAAVAHVRHVASDPDHLRRGIGRAIMARVFQEAVREGARSMDCLSTRTAVPFYAAVGFRPIGEVSISLAPGIEFPAERMVCNLAQRQG